jgi:hypothetical protein
VSKRLIAVLLGTLAIAALVAGCGGGDDEGTTVEATSSDTGPALTKAEFIEQGDEICLTASNDRGKEIEDFLEENNVSQAKGPTTEQEEELLGEIVLPRIGAQMEELRELGPPEGEEERVDEIFTAVEEVVAEGEDDPSTVIGNENPFAEPNAKAEAFGFEVCGQT